jgi:hypothetical protein
MKPVVKNSLAVVSGIVAGSAINMLLVTLSPMIISPPEGTEINTMEGLEAAIPLMDFKHFIMPFLAHALGTLAGAWFAAKIAATRAFVFALAIGGWFMLGGIANVFMLPSPLWFTLADLVLAYLPMAYLGAKLAGKHYS